MLYTGTKKELKIYKSFKNIEKTKTTGAAMVGELQRDGWLRINRGRVGPAGS